MAITRIGVQPVVVTPGQANARQTYRVVEIEDGKAGAESQEVSCSNDLSVGGNVNFIHWEGEAALYRVLRASDGPFRKIGEVEGSSFVDEGPEAA